MSAGNLTGFPVPTVTGAGVVGVVGVVGVGAGSGVGSEWMDVGGAMGLYSPATNANCALLANPVIAWPTVASICNVWADSDCAATKVNKATPVRGGGVLQQCLGEGEGSMV